MRKVFYGTGDVLAATGADVDRLHRAVQRGDLRPLAGGGKGRYRVYGPEAALAIAVGEGLRRRGLSAEASGRAVRWVSGQELGDLEANFAAGRRLLVIVGDEPMPRLVTPMTLAAWATDPAQADVRDALASGSVGAALVLDLAAAWGHVRTALEATAARQRSQGRQGASARH